MNGKGDSHDTDGCSNGEGLQDIKREPTDIEKEALERKIKLGIAHEYTLGTINYCLRSGSKYLDLNNKNLSAIPEELLSLSHLEYLYLEGNHITQLPEDFFQKLSSLKWLDLRNNKLLSLPSAYIGSHRNLTHLLLQGNQLQNLPLELGLVSTVEALNISGNPIKFPAPHVIAKGVREILAYLKHMLLSKSNGNLHPATSNAADGADDSLDADDMGSESEEEEDTSGFTRSNRPRSGVSRERPSSGKSESSEVTGKTVSLHKQQTYQQLKKDKMDKIKKAGAAGKLDSRQKPAASRHMEVNLFPEPPSAELIDQKVREKQLQAIHREKNEKIDAILQRRRDEEKLKKFRDDAKTMQKQKEYEKYMNGGKLDFVEPGSQAPFDIADEDMKVMTNEERIKKGVKEQHERIRKVLSPRAIKQMEQEKREKEKELKEKIREHTDGMKARRKKAKGNPQEEMEAALRELEIAKRLQHELDLRRKQLDYRFRAYNPPF